MCKVKYSQGFTLIELIIVIVILGIVSLIAAPKFIDLSTDANVAKMESLKGSVQAGATMVFTKSVLQGVNKQLNSEVDIDGDDIADIDTHSGFPGVMANCNQFVSQLPLWLDINLPTTCTSGRVESEEWIGIYGGWHFYFIPAGFTDQNDNCYLLYTEARSTSGGVAITQDNIGLQLETSGC